MGLEGSPAKVVVKCHAWGAFGVPRRSLSSALKGQRARALREAQLTRVSGTWKTQSTLLPSRYPSQGSTISESGTIQRSQSEI